MSHRSCLTRLLPSIDGFHWGGWKVGDMALWLMTWGGTIMDSKTAGIVIEEWSNSLALIATGGPDLEDTTTSISGNLTTWFTSPNTHINATVKLLYLKINEYDLTTGHQITDPTNEVDYTSSNIRGGGAADGAGPTTTAYRVSIDDGTRDRSSKGGFFVPRTDLPVGLNGRVSSTNVDDVLENAKFLLDSLNAKTGITVGVWSRKNHAVTASTRVRVGDVLDNISTRKNQMPETYTVDVIAP